MRQFVTFAGASLLLSIGDTQIQVAHALKIQRRYRISLTVADLSPFLQRTISDLEDVKHKSNSDRLECLKFAGVRQKILAINHSSLPDKDKAELREMCDLPSDGSDDIPKIITPATSLAPVPFAVAPLMKKDGAFERRRKIERRGGDDFSLVLGVNSENPHQSHEGDGEPVQSYSQAIIAAVNEVGFSPLTNAELPNFASRDLDTGLTDNDFKVGIVGAKLSSLSLNVASSSQFDEIQMDTTPTESGSQASLKDSQQHVMLIHTQELEQNSPIAKKLQTIGKKKRADAGDSTSTLRLETKRPLFFHTMVGDGTHSETWDYESFRNKNYMKKERERHSKENASKRKEIFEFVLLAPLGDAGNESTSSMPEGLAIETKFGAHAYDANGFDKTSYVDQFSPDFVDGSMQNFTTGNKFKSSVAIAYNYRVDEYNVESQMYSRAPSQQGVLAPSTFTVLSVKPSSTYKRRRSIDDPTMGETVKRTIVVLRVDAVDGTSEEYNRLLKRSNSTSSTVQNSTYTRLALTKFMDIK